MVRRSISLLVLVAFAVTQWAAIPHAHEGLEGDKHGTIPHVHLACLCGHDHHQHDHGHTHCGHEDHHAETVGQISLAGVPAGHDDDAVYLPSLTTSTVRSGDRTAWLSAAPLWVTVAPLQAPAKLTEDSFLVDSGPPLRGGTCALYLSLRTLRI